MKIHGRARLRDFLGDFIVYRNLRPIDPRLPSLAELRPHLGLPIEAIPRKTTLEYARVVTHIIQHARAVTAKKEVIERLIYIGDTRVNDATAFLNLCRCGGWHGAAFIGAETTDPARVEITGQAERVLFLSNRWSALDDFDRFCRERRIPIDEHTAVVIDLDKTSLGARGRNDHIIDAVRLESIRCTIGNLLGDRFDEQSFQSAYDELNQPRFHPFTTDNQDYLAYICLILESGLMNRGALVKAVCSAKIEHFTQFLSWVDERTHGLPPRLQQVHRRVRAAVAQGNPTPFVEFRCNEYRITADRMGCLDNETPMEALLKQEIVITHEVRESALRWCDKGALLFGLSDKPDEASIPTSELAARGYRPIHETQTHVIGG